MEVVKVLVNAGGFEWQMRLKSRIPRTTAQKRDTSASIQRMLLHWPSNTICYRQAVQTVMGPNLENLALARFVLHVLILMLFGNVHTLVAQFSELFV